MEEQYERQGQGFLSRLKGMFSPAEEEDEEQMAYEPGQRPRPALRLQHNHPYHVSVRKELNTIEDARVAADGLKEGIQQIINLSVTKPELRERVIDFLSGVVYALEGTVEKIGDQVFLFAPRQAVVDMAPATGRFRHDD